MIDTSWACCDATSEGGEIPCRSCPSRTIAARNSRIERARPAGVRGRRGILRSAAASLACSRLSAARYATAAGLGAVVVVVVVVVVVPVVEVVVVEVGGVVDDSSWWTNRVVRAQPVSAAALTATAIRLSARPIGTQPIGGSRWRRLATGANR